MDKQQLHERLAQLHTELQQVESVDDKDREILQRLARDIQELLEESGGGQAHQHHRLGERLRESVEQLEAAHPNLTMLMGQVADALARMGI
ncbi:MAG TPA: DUF4404 family protein [Blastocatellia bacterium]|nr:DUF4404 family protein [Blastocatellia bacterium]